LKSSTETPKVLFDTSYILPTLGISVGPAIERNIKLLTEVGVEIYYSRLSILESLWVAARTIQDGSFDPERYRLGLRSIIDGGGYKRVDEDSQIFTEALKLYSLGHKDMIDNMLYASAVHLNMRLVTRDRELEKFVLEKKLKNVLSIFPDEPSPKGDSS